MGKFGVIGGGFVRDGLPHRVLSGAMHYFRVLPPQWRHRLKTMRAMGLNCVETYVPWNFHEPRPGVYSRIEQLGWFSHWGGERITRDPADAAGTLRRILDCGASVNLYMAHGGTNFGAWAGANRGEPMHSGVLQADITSYDYDAPIDERGRPTEKFFLFKEILQGYAGSPLPELPKPEPVLAPRAVDLPERLALLDVMEGLPSVESPTPPTFEELGLHHGLVLYRFSLSAPLHAYPLKVEAERATLLGEGEDIGVLVESVGRANYGPRLGEPEGIVGHVTHGHQIVHGFTATAFAVDDISGLPWGTTGNATRGPVLSRGWLDLDEVGDTAVVTPGVKGYVWVNGFLLGRYWSIGPQTELYLPWPLLRVGRNEIVVLELEAEPVTTLSLL